MQKFFTFFRSALSFVLVLILNEAIGQCPNYPSMRQTFHTVDIGTYVKGYLEYLPPDYNSNTPHPLIIYFHGAGEVGNGTPSSLCNLLTAANTFDIPFPERIEQPSFSPSVTYNGHNYSYVIMSPQYFKYDFAGNQYPRAQDVEAVINYALATYGNKIDRNRIYLTGMSTGANMIVDYATSSLARASNVAGLYSVSLCILTPVSGTSNIANANLPYWGVHCMSDNSGCDFAFHQNWVNAINSNSPPPNPLAKLTGLSCSDHNAWNTAYDPTFTDGGLNFFNWAIQYSRSFALPAKLKGYSVRLDKSKAIVEWTTTNETNTSKFILERAGANQDFEIIAETAAAGTSSTDKRYAMVDDQPNAGVNLYRLSLVNIDGRKEYFDIKKLNNPTGWSGIVSVPNPVKVTMNVYLTLERKERVNIQLFDLNGRLLKEIKKDFYPGVTENKIDVSALSHGTYLLRVTGETSTVNKKIMIN